MIKCISIFIYFSLLWAQSDDDAYSYPTPSVVQEEPLLDAKITLGTLGGLVGFFVGFVVVGNIEGGQIGGLVGGYAVGYLGGLLGLHIAEKLYSTEHRPNGCNNPPNFPHLRSSAKRYGAGSGVVFLRH